MPGLEVLEGRAQLITERGGQGVWQSPPKVRDLDLWRAELARDHIPVLELWPYVGRGNLQKLSPTQQRLDAERLMAGQVVADERLLDPHRLGGVLLCPAMLLLAHFPEATQPISFNLLRLFDFLARLCWHMQDISNGITSGHFFRPFNCLGYCNQPIA